MFLLAGMGPPGGGRMVISRRLQSRFNLINMTFPHVRFFLLILVPSNVYHIQNVQGIKCSIMLCVRFGLKILQFYKQDLLFSVRVLVIKLQESQIRYNISPILLL